MIEQELILLGLLRERPTHGYEIKKKINEILSLFAGVDLKSIYYPLRVLEQKGLVVKRKNRPGRRPERFVYALTPKGESRFKELLNKSFLDFKRPQFSLDLSLYFFIT
jgi:DNA-binding PadR family transcriptional regulator